MSDTEKDDLESLLASPGWARLKAYAQAEYGPQIIMRVATEENDAAALLKLRQATAINGAIDVLLDYPGRRLKELAPVEDARSRFARGGLS
jgi:hypothetical protein